MCETDCLQEDAPDLLFRDIAIYTQTVGAAEQAPAVFHQAIAEGYGAKGVARLRIPAMFGIAKLHEAVSGRHGRVRS